MTHQQPSQIELPLTYEKFVILLTMYNWDKQMIDEIWKDIDKPVYASQLIKKKE